MNAKEISNCLRESASSDDFIARVSAMTEEWSAAPDGFDAVEPILQFMEENPGLDYGMPGPLVHFVEGFFGKGYEEKLLDSLARRPTVHTVWMLNRLINGIDDPETRSALIEVMSLSVNETGSGTVSDRSPKKTEGKQEH